VRALFQFFLIIIFLSLTSAFAALNDAMVSINYFVGRSEIRLAYLILACIAGGSLMTILLVMGTYVRSKVEIRRLKKTVQINNQELSNLREMPVQDR